MPLERYANTPTPLTPGTAWTTSSALISAIATTLPVTSHTPFPSSAQFRILVNSSAGWEWMLVTAGGGTTSWTVTRGIEGSTAYAHPAGATIVHVVTAAGLLNNPGGMTTSGDFQYLNASFVPTRLAAPSNGDYVMRFTSAVPSWVAAPSGGAPGGSTTQVQFNNAGAFGGSSNLTWNEAILRLGGGSDSPMRIQIDSTLADTAAISGSLIGGSLYSAAIPTQNTGDLYAINVDVSSNVGVGLTTSSLYGSLNAANMFGAGTVTNAYGQYGVVEAWDGVITNAYAMRGDLRENGGVITNGYAFYVADLAGDATNPYYLWFDSRGVYRVREDNVADGSGNPQAIPALYNPRVTKYVAGAADFERSVEQWVNNVLQIGSEKGGTGTLRALQLLGASVSTLGNITAANLSGTNTGDQTTISGNAGTATSLQTARTINGVSFNGTADITITAAAGTLTGATLASGVTASSLTSFGTSPTLVTPILGVAAFTSLTGSGATVTVSTPLLNLSQTWNSGAVTFKGAVTNITNTASAAGSSLESWEIGGAAGAAIITNTYSSTATLAVQLTSLTNSSQYTRIGQIGAGLYLTSSTFDYSLGSTGWTMASTLALNWSQNGVGGNMSQVDLSLRRVAAATMQMGADTNGAAVSQIVQACNGITGTDRTGGNFTFASGKGTGAGAVSSLIFQTPTVLGSGTTAQSLATRMTIVAGLVTLADATDIGINATTGTKIGQSTSKLGFYGVTPIVQAVLATGAGATVDNVISALQNLGLVKQS